MSEPCKCRPPNAYQGHYGWEVSPSMYFLFDAGETWDCPCGHTWTYTVGRWSAPPVADERTDPPIQSTEADK